MAKKPENRSYNKKDVGKLIQRATELHEKATDVDASSLSLKEVEQIAEELGLPAEYARAAALELDGGYHAGNSPGLWGGPFSVHQVRVVDEEITQEKWEQLVMNIRSITGKKGQVEEMGSIREWTHMFGEGDGGVNFHKTRIAVKSEKQQTSVHIDKQFKGLALLYVIPLFLLIFLSATLLTEAPELFKYLLAIGLSGGAFAATRAFVSSRTRRENERIDDLADMIHQTLTPTSNDVTSEESVERRIEIPEHEEQEPTARDSHQRTRA